MDQQTQHEYGIKVEMFIGDPKYAGTISEEEAKALGASLFSYSYGDETLGYKLTLHWAVNTHENTIVLARYTYDGVRAGIAVNHMLALLCTNKDMPGVENINYQGLERLLRDNPKDEALPSTERYAITFAIDAAKLAVKKYIHASLSHEEQSTPCKDSPMSLASIKESIALHNIQSLESLVEYTKAGSSDTECKENLLSLIDAQQKALAEQQEAENALSDKPFKELSDGEKIIAVEIAIDNTVRQFLHSDGGDIDIINVKEEDGMYVVYISYLGACSDCSSSGTGTLYAIQNALRDKLDPDIHVIAI